MDPIVLVLVVIGVVVLGGGTAIGAGVAAARRRRAAELTRSESAAATREVEAGQALVRTDDRIRAAQDELGFAAAQFGENSTRELSGALERARGRLSEAFRLRQALDDHLPDTPQQRHEWTEQILALCASAEEALGDRLQALDRLRAQERQAPDDLARVRASVAGVRGRVPAARVTLQRLEEQYSPDAVGTIAINPDQSERLLGVVERSLDLAERRVAEGRGSDVPSVLHASRDALERAGALLDAVEHLEVETLRAESTLAALRAELEEDLRDARMARSETTDAARRASLDGAISTAESARDGLPGDAERRDPLGVVATLRQADAALDSAIAEHRDHAARQDAARARLVTALDDAERRVAVARDLVSGYRGPIGPEARTRLTEAERLLDGITEERDPSTAVERARRVAHLAAESASLGQRDLEEARRASSRGGYDGGYGRGGGGDIAGAVIGGLVVGGLLEGLGDGLGDLFD